MRFGKSLCTKSWLIVQSPPLIQSHMCIHTHTHTHTFHMCANPQNVVIRITLSNKCYINTSNFQLLHWYEHYNVSRYYTILYNITYEPPSHLLSHLASTTILYFLLVFIHGPALPEYQISCPLTTSCMACEGYAWSRAKSHTREELLLQIMLSTDCIWGNNEIIREAKFAFEACRFVHTWWQRSFWTVTE
jgi:hypothetical protein